MLDQRLVKTLYEERERQIQKRLIAQQLRGQTPQRKRAIRMLNFELALERIYALYATLGHQLQLR